MANQPNAAMARWASALQQEASDLLHDGQILQFRRFDLPPDWEFDLCSAMSNHAEGRIPSAMFSAVIKAKRALLPRVRPYGAGGAQ